MSAITVTKHQSRYSVAELILIMIAAAIVGFTVWYVQHATRLASTTYSIHESSQKPAAPKHKSTAPTATIPQ